MPKDWAVSLDALVSLELGMFQVTFGVPYLWKFWKSTSTAFFVLK